LAPIAWDTEEIRKELTVLFPTTMTDDAIRSAGTVESVAQQAQEEAHTLYDIREEEFGAKMLRAVERRVMLSVIDNKWREHLAEMGYLRGGIGLRAMGQKDPLVEYQREAFDAFNELVNSAKHDAVRYLFHVQVQEQQAVPVAPRVQVTETSGGGQAKPVQAKAVAKIGRNEPCHCGSGKKYKKCHGAIE